MTTHTHQVAEQGRSGEPLTPPVDPKPVPRYFSAFALAAIGLVLIAGSLQFCKLSALVTRHEQDALLSHTASAARSLSLADFDTLSFTADDA